MQKSAGKKVSDPRVRKYLIIKKESKENTYKFEYMSKHTK